MRFPTLCLSRNFLILGVMFASRDAMGCAICISIYTVGLGEEGGGAWVFGGFLLLFLLCLPRDVVDFLCCALFWALCGAACDVCAVYSCVCVYFYVCVEQSLFSLVLMLLIMLIVLPVRLSMRCGVAASYSICNRIGVCKYVCTLCVCVCVSLPLCPAGTLCDCS